MAHWWNVLCIMYDVLRPGCLQWLSRKNRKCRTVQLLARLLTQQTHSSTHLCVKRACFLWSLIALRVNGKRLMTTDEETETETHLQLLIAAIGAAKENEMKIFEITTLNTATSVNALSYHTGLKCALCVVVVIICYSHSLSHMSSRSPSLQLERHSSLERNWHPWLCHFQSFLNQS